MSAEAPVEATPVPETVNAGCCGCSHSHPVESIVHVQGHVTDKDVNTYGERATAHPSKGKYTGMVKERSTTDFLFFIAIVCCWVAMSGIGGDCINRGSNIYNIIRPMDMRGTNKSIIIFLSLSILYLIFLFANLCG